MTTNKIDNSIIRIGIDLGTTNSEVAVCFGDEVEVVKNGMGDEYTPSVLGIDKGGNQSVGKNPYAKLFRKATEEEIQNNKAEVKRLMGIDEKIKFPRANKTYSPEEISAEILKSLKSDILRKYPDAATFSAVITVPAYFEIPQKEATKRAGYLAGFEHVELLQEPISAAIAYGFNANEDANWLVYDLGGGTFDVALVSSQDGLLKVLEHGGDNFLGGKDIDEALVKKVLIPAILNEYTFKKFEPSGAVLARLKGVAEEAKISLTSNETVNIEIDDIGQDDEGRDIFLSLNYTREAFNELIKPIIDKTIEVANGVIERSKLPRKYISKVILVGAPTQIPYLRERIKEDLKIDVDTSVDPLTTVAVGACIYGLGSRVPDEVVLKHHEPTSKKEYHVSLNYDSMTSNEDQLLTGTIDIPDDDDYYVKISSEGGYYTSENIKVKNGKFFDTLLIEPNKTNKYWIYLIDSSGNNIPIFPDSFSITHGLTVQGIPIPHDIGVIYSRKSFESDFQFTEVCDKYFERSSILPLERTESYKTIVRLEKDADNPLPIKIYEGDSDNPAINRTLTTLEIDGSELPYNLPKGTDLDLTIRIDESSTMTVEAYIPSIDLSVTKKVRVDTYIQKVDNKALRQELELQKQRVLNINTSDNEKTSLQSEIESIENNVNDSDDTDSQQKASRDISKLKERIDEIESSSAIEDVIKQFRKLVKDVEALIEEVKQNDISTGERLYEQLAQIKDDGEDAITRQDKAMLNHQNDLLTTLRIQAMAENPYFWLAMLENLKQKDINSFTNPSEAEYHLTAAENAKNSGDIEELKRNVRELLSLLPQDEQAELSGGMSGITKS